MIFRVRSNTCQTFPKNLYKPDGIGENIIFFLGGREASQGFPQGGRKKRKHIKQTANSYKSSGTIMATITVIFRIKWLGISINKDDYPLNSNEISWLCPVCFDFPEEGEEQGKGGGEAKIDWQLNYSYFSCIYFSR